MKYIRLIYSKTLAKFEKYFKNRPEAEILKKM